MKISKLFLASAVCASMLFAGCSENGGGDEPKTYNITILSGDNGAASADKTTATEGEAVTLTAKPDTGYSFKQWSGEGVSFTPNATTSKAGFMMPARNIIVSAEFVATEYTVTVTSGGNGTATADKATAAEGATVKLTATADPHCEFVKWTVESGGAELSSLTAATATFTMPAGEVKVKAEFVARGVSINGTVWALCNVDAPGTFAENPAVTGMYYQWNRRTGWSSTDPLISIPLAEAGWYPSYEAGNKWDAANDPCPEGWRVPTHNEHVALCDAEKVENEPATLNGTDGLKFTDVEEPGNSIFLPFSGYRSDSDGSIRYVGEHGLYWSATENGNIYGYSLDINITSADHSGKPTRAYGISVRCVAK